MPGSSDGRHASPAKQFEPPQYSSSANGQPSDSGIHNGKPNFAVSREAFSFDDEDTESDEIGDEAPSANDEEDISPEALLKRLAKSREVDYYSLLGLSREPPPTEGQLRSAYHQLSLAVHPDKHPPSSRNAALTHFKRIQDAFDTLIDPKRKVIYDLLGEEGVRAEWSREGSMGGGLGRSLEVGQRAMSPEEFRRWFIDLMRSRERQIVADMVESRGTITAGFDASSMFSFDESEGFRLHWPHIRPYNYQLKYSFKVSLPSPKALYTSTTTTDEADLSSSSNALSSLLPDAEAPQLYFNASFGGPMRKLLQKVEVVDETGTTETRKVAMPPSIFTRAFSLGTTAYYTIPGKASEDVRSSSISSLAAGSTVEIGGLIFPQPFLRAAISRSFTPVEGARPITVRVESTTFDHPLRIPPVLAVSLSRQVGEQVYAYCSWRSGGIFWPLSLRQILQPLLTLGPIEDGLYQIQGGTSGFSLGFTSLASYPPQSDQDAGTGQEDNPYEANAKSSSKTFSGAAWGCEINSTPGGSSLSVNYGRNVFRGVVEPLVRSEWSAEGKASPAADIVAAEGRAVRLELEGSIALDGSMGWMVRGSRKFGSFTRMGLAAGVQGPRGLVLTITWNRLGQAFQIPVAVCPVQIVNPDIVAMMVGLPWLTYAAVEYGLLRPRRARKRRKAIARRRKQLTALVAQKQVESKQAIELMAEQVKRRQAKERASNGLVILRAEYGVSENPSRTWRRWRKDKANSKSSEMVDVTIPVAALIHQSQLTISRTISKDQIFGFYDPAPLKKKKLRIQYLFAGQEHFLEAADDEDIICPKRGHEITTDVE